MNLIAVILLLSAVIVCLVDYTGRSARRLLSLGLALFAAGVLIAGVWPDQTVLFD